MIENNKNEISLELNRVEKKEWMEPQISQLNLRETKSGDFQNDTEGGFWIFTWGPS